MVPPTPIFDWEIILNLRGHKRHNHYPVGQEVPEKDAYPAAKVTACLYETDGSDGCDCQYCRDLHFPLNELVWTLPTLHMITMRHEVITMA